MAVNGQGGMEIDGAFYALEHVQDVQYLGMITDYHTFSDMGEVDGVYRFSLKDCLKPVEFGDMIYHEFECLATCHLEICDNAICAVDVQLLRQVHVLNKNILSKDKFLYTFTDGRHLAGILQTEGDQHYILTEKGEAVPFSNEDVADVTRFPLINDFVTASMADGKMVSGIVSAVQQEYLLVIEGILPQMVFYKDLSELRYHGVVTENGTIDSIYQYKLPYYLKDKNRQEDIFEGTRVSYVAGVNGRYRIAKNIVSEESAAQKKPDGAPEQYGVILMVDMKKPDGVGYIGSEYRTKACGEQPKGNVRFKRGQLPFEYDFSKIYVVKYSLRSAGMENRPAILNKMELVREIDFAETGIVRVSDDGKVEVLPMYRAIPRYYENRDVDIICREGMCSGVLAAQEEKGIRLQNRDEEDTGLIPYEEIKTVRIKGQVSRYNPNGTGYVDNVYFFHINDIGNISMATKIHEGVLLSFELRNTRKGAGYICSDIEVIGETLDGYAVGYQEDCLLVVAEEDYEKNGGNAARYSIYMESDVKFSELDKYDYHAIFILKMKGNRMECLSAQVREAVPKELEGFAVDLEEETIRIATAEQYENGGERIACFLTNFQQIQKKINNIDRYDYPVRYRFFNQNSVEITFIGEAREKLFYGFIDTYYNDRQFGYITPEQYYGKKTFVERLKENIDVWCRPMTFVNAPGTLDTSLYTYYVKYTLDYSVHDAKSPAFSVTFLKSLAKNQKTVPAAPAPVKEATLSFRVETVNLAEKKQNEMERLYAYGILAAYSPSFGELKISEVYQNKKYYDDDFSFSDRGAITVDASKVSLQSQDKITTAKYAYVVRFVPQAGDEASGKSAVNYDFPIEIIGRYNKKQIRKLETVGETLKLEMVQRTDGKAAEPADGLEEQLNFGTDIVPEPEEGETFFYRTEDGSVHFAEFEYEREGILYLAGGQTVEKDSAVIYRLGILTDFDAQFQNGCLNDGVRFNFSVMENKTFNIAKTARKSMLLVYRTENGRVTHVEKPSSEMLSQLPWTERIVTGVEGSEKSRVIRLDGEITHYLSVLTDGLVSRLAKNGSLTDKMVYIRQVNCPIWNSKEDAETVMVAADIHCEEEAAVIRYDAVKDRYFAYRDQTHFEPVKGNVSVLQQLVEQSATVYFLPGETGLQLEAWIEKGVNPSETVEGDQEYEDAEEQNTTITDSVLGQYCLKHVDLRQMILPGKTDLDEEGWPVSAEQASRLMEGLCRGTAPAANMIAAAAIGRRMEPSMRRKVFARINRQGLKVRNNEGLLRRAFKRRSEEIIRDGNGNLGEYSYYVTMLLRESQSAETKRENLYRLFLPDFRNRWEIREELNTFDKSKRYGEALEQLFAQNCSAENARQVIAHIMPLDEQSAEFLFDTGLIEKNDTLVQIIMRLGNEIDNTRYFDNSTDCLKMLRAAYQRDKNFYLGARYLGGEFENGCKQWYDTLQKISQRFTRLICREDMERFQRLADCCRKVAVNQTAGYNDRERTLSEAYQEIRDLSEEVKEHPTQQTLEMLVRCNLPEKVQKEIVTELDQLYRNENTLPLIQCRANSSEVLRGETSDRQQEKGKTYIQLLVENGTDDVPDRQAARDVVFYFQMLTEDDISIISEMKLPQNELKPGKESRCELVVPVEIGRMEGSGFSIQWSVKYTYIDGFDGKKIYRQEPVEVDGQILNFQFYHALHKAEKEDVENPYEDPAGGNPLGETSDMFYGRQNEVNEIWNYLVDIREEWIPGRTIIVYGQKRCGKTSLINHIKNKAKKSKKVNEQAIMLHIPDMAALFAGPEELPYFNRFLYDKIFMLFKREIRQNHPDVEKLLAEKNLTIPNLRERYPDSKEYVYDMPSQEFTNFFEDFELYDKRQHKIILIMDEFTGLCTSIMRNLSAHPEYQNYPKFIKMLSGMGFIQIVVGHAAMMRALGELGVINSTAEFAMKIEISALQEEDCKKLVREPMEGCFGFDVYGTELGNDAVEKLLELSGCSPSILMKLCDRMFRYFVEKKEGNYIDKADVDLMLKSYLRSLKTSDFDMLLTEDGDEANLDYEKPSYIYLRHISRESWKNNNHDCDSETVCTELVSKCGLPQEELQSAAEIESAKMREILFDRKVISVSNGRIRIIMWLFAEFLKFKDGANL